MAEDQGFVRRLVCGVMQEVLEAGDGRALGAKPGERTEGRLGCLCPAIGTAASPPSSVHDITGVFLSRSLRSLASSLPLPA